MSSSIEYTVGDGLWYKTSSDNFINVCEFVIPDRQISFIDISIGVSKIDVPRIMRVLDVVFTDANTPDQIRLVIEHPVGAEFDTPKTVRGICEWDSDRTVKIIDEYIGSLVIHGDAYVFYLING